MGRAPKSIEGADVRAFAQTSADRNRSAPARSGTDRRARSRGRRAIARGNDSQSRRVLRHRSTPRTRPRDGVDASESCDRSAAPRSRSRPRADGRSRIASPRRRRSAAVDADRARRRDPRASLTPVSRLRVTGAWPGRWTISGIRDQGSGIRIEVSGSVCRGTRNLPDAIAAPDQTHRPDPPDLPDPPGTAPRYRTGLIGLNHMAMHATFDTSEGTFKVRLFDDKAPKTVANFVELAEGTKEWTDPKSRQKGEAAVLRWPRFSPRDRRVHAARWVSHGHRDGWARLPIC